MLSAKNIQVITYEKLIADTQEMYRQYLEKKEDKGRISQLLDAIDS